MLVNIYQKVVLSLYNNIYTMYKYYIGGAKKIVTPPWAAVLAQLPTSDVAYNFQTTPQSFNSCQYKDLGQGNGSKIGTS